MRAAGAAPTLFSHPHFDNTSTLASPCGRWCDGLRIPAVTVDHLLVKAMRNNPSAVTLADYPRAAGSRWKIEESFQSGKGLAGLDEHQVRTWTSWHRWITLAMFAHASLAVTPPPAGALTHPPTTHRPR